MSEVFAAIEQTGLSVWTREDPYAYFLLLIFHAFGMALLVGGGVVVSLRILGVGRDARLARFRGFLPAIWWGGAVAALSGLLLLIAYPAKALTNPLFAIKLASLIAAALLLRDLARHMASPPGETKRQQRAVRVRAAIALALWMSGVAAGKLLLHTYAVLTVT